MRELLVPIAKEFTSGFVHRTKELAHKKRAALLKLSSVPSLVRKEERTDGPGK